MKNIKRFNGHIHNLYHYDSEGEMIKYADVASLIDDLVAALQGILRVADRATDEFDAARVALKKAGVL